MLPRTVPAIHAKRLYPPRPLRQNLFIGFPVKNPFMAPFHKILRPFPMVHLMDLADRVYAVGLLQQHIPGNLLIAEKLYDACAGNLRPMPADRPRLIKIVRQHFLRMPFQIKLRRPPQKSRFLRHDLQPVIHKPVSEHIHPPWKPLLEITANPPPLVFRSRPCLLLRIRRQQGKHKFPILPQRMDILLLKIHIHPDQPELPNRLQCCDRIPGKP